MCIYLAANDWNQDEYQAATRKQNEGNLELPQVIGFPPKTTHDVRVYINMKRLSQQNPSPDLRQAENFAISCAPSFTVPWNCMEAAVSMEDNALIWVNPDFYSAYLSQELVPSTVAATVTPAEWSQHATEHTERQRRNAKSHLLVERLLLDKYRSANIALCSMCATKQQVGTLRCYLCARPMIQREPLPITHDMISMLVCSKAPNHDNRGDAPMTVGNLTWGQRVLMWRKSCFKKKDAWGKHIYHYTEWPLSERWKYDIPWRQRCSEMSHLYFGREFTKAMAVEADKIAWDLWQAEQANLRAEAAQQKGKSRGRPVNATTSQSTYEV